MFYKLKRQLFEVPTFDGMPLFVSCNQMALEISRYQCFEIDNVQIKNRYYGKQAIAFSNINRVLRNESPLKPYIQSIILGVSSERTRELPHDGRCSVLSELSTLLYSFGRNDDEIPAFARRGDELPRPLLEAAFGRKADELPSFVSKAYDLPRALLEAALETDKRDSESLHALASLENSSGLTFSKETFASLLQDTVTAGRLEIVT